MLKRITCADATRAPKQSECPSVRDRRLRTMCHRLATDGRLMQHQPSLSDDGLMYHCDDDDICAHLLAIAQVRGTKVLIRVPWGLGDAVQLTCILQHLAKHRLDWSIDVATGIGKHTAFAGLCRRSLVLDRDHIDDGLYDQVFDLNLYECYAVYEDSPCTKVCNCLREVFGIEPELELLKYHVRVSGAAFRLVRDYLEEICAAAGRVGQALRGPAAAGSVGATPFDAPYTGRKGELRPGRSHAELGNEAGGNEVKSEIPNPKSQIRLPSPATPLPGGEGRNEFPVVAIHYQGNTSSFKKDIPNDLVYRLCRKLIERGFVPLVLDWDRRSPLPDEKTIFCPGVGPGDLWGNTGTGDAERLAALISQCALMIGIDSGPLHVAGATQTPTLAVWTGHSPIQFYDLCDNVTHLVPTRWREVPPCQNAAAARFFETHYSYRTYEDLEQTLTVTAIEWLDHSKSVPLAHAPPHDIKVSTKELTSGAPIMLSHNSADIPNRGPTNYGRDFLVRSKAKGLDLLAYGSSQERYGYWLVDALGLDGRRVLDAGCACGSKLRGMLRAGADMQGVDCSEFLVEMGRRQWPELCDRLFVADAVNMHCFADNTFDWLHSCSVAECWRPELVPFILAELFRVLKPGGSFYCAYESGAGTMANAADPPDEPTRPCLKPASWWEDQVRQAGWQLTSCDWAKRLREHPQSFFAEYRAWFVARKPP